MVSPLDRLRRPRRVKQAGPLSSIEAQSANNNRKALQVHAVDYNHPENEEKTKPRWSKNLRQSLKNGGSTMYRLHQQRRKARETQRTTIVTASSVTQSNDLLKSTTRIPASSSWSVKTIAATNLQSTLPLPQSTSTMTFARLVEMQQQYTSSTTLGSTRVLMSASGDDGGESWGRSFAQRDEKAGRRYSLSRTPLLSSPRKGDSPSKNGDEQSSSLPTSEKIQKNSRTIDEDKKPLPAQQHENEKVTSSQNATTKSQKERTSIEESPRKSPPSSPTKSKRSPRRRRKGLKSSPPGKDSAQGTIQASLSDITLDSPPQWGDFGALNSPERHEMMFSTLSVDESDKVADTEKIVPKSLFQTIPHSPDLREAPDQMRAKKSPASTEELRIWSLPRYESTVAATTRAEFQGGKASTDWTTGKAHKSKSPKSKKKKEQSEKKVDSLQWGDYGQLSSPERKTTLDRLVDRNTMLDPIPRFDPKADHVLIKSNHVSWNKMMSFAAGLDDQNDGQGVPWLRDMNNSEIDSDEGSATTQNSRKALTDKLDGIVSRKEGSFMNQFNEKLQNFNHSDSFQDLKNFWEKSVNDATSPPSYKKPDDGKISSEPSKASLPTSDSVAIPDYRRKLSTDEQPRNVEASDAVAHRKRNKEDTAPDPPTSSLSSIDGSIGNVQSKHTVDTIVLSPKKEEEMVCIDEPLPPRREPTKTLPVKNEINHNLTSITIPDEPAERENAKTIAFALVTVRDAAVQNFIPPSDAVESKAKSSPEQLIKIELTEEEAPMPKKEKCPEDECTSEIARPDPPICINDEKDSGTNAKSRRRLCFADEKGLPMEHVIEVGGKDDPYSSGRIVVLLLNPALKKFEFLHAEHLLREKATVQDLLEQLPTFSSTQVFQDSKYYQLYTTKYERRMLGCEALLMDCDIDPTDVLVAVPTNSPSRDHIDCATPLLGSDHVMAAVRHARRTGRGLKHIQSASDRKSKSKKKAESTLPQEQLTVPQLDVKDEVPEIPVLRSEREDSRKVMRALQTGLVAAIGIFYTVNNQ